MTATSLSDLEPILAHELIHFRRGDTQFGWFQVAAQVLWWFHPLVWWASRHATLERERCCDEEAVKGFSYEPADYAQSLIDVLNQKRQLKPLYALPGMRVFEITAGRLEHIMQRSDQFCRRTPRWHWATFLLIAAILLPGSGFVMQWGNAHADDTAERFPIPNNSKSGEWNQFCGSSHRNNSPDGENVPTKWDYKTGKNIRWSAKLGSSTYNSPVITDGKVLIGTNNQAGYIKQYPSHVDLSCLLCFDENTGDFLWQYSIEKLARDLDWPMLGLCSVPMVEGKRVWLVTTRCEVVCLDIDGFQDKENDGPFRNEKLKSENDADIIWKYNMLDLLKIHPHNLSNCSVTCAGDVLLVGTANGVDPSHLNLPNPDAPSFIALDRNTGRLLWQSNLPGKNVMHGQWSSPAYGVIGGSPQVIFAGGDGWLYAFDLRDLRTGKTNLLWWFDCNPKQSKWMVGGRGGRNNILSSPVIYDGLIYIAVGQDLEHGEGDGHLWCIDPTKRGDISSELVYNRRDPTTPIPHKRVQACEPEKGDFVRVNPNSGVVWDYDKRDRNGDGKFAFEETIHRTVSTPTIKHDLLVIPDVSGLVHCVDAKTGHVFWAYDMFASCSGTPLIVDGKIYVGNEDGNVSIFKLSKELVLLETIEMDNSIFGSLVFAGDSLYIPTQSRLYSVVSPKRDEAPKTKPETSAATNDVIVLPPKWKLERHAIDFESSPLISKEIVYVSDCDGFVYSIDRKSGKINWRFSVESGFNAAPSHSKNRLYIGDIEGRFYCVDALTGEKQWAFHTQAEISGAAAFHENRVIFCSHDGHLYCVENSTGQLLWKHDGQDQIRSTPAVVGDLVIVSGCFGKLLVFDVKTGQVVGNFDLESPTMSSPAARDGLVYVGTEEGHLFCIDLKSIKLVWRHEPTNARGIRGQPAVTNEMVLFGSCDNYLYGLDRRTGKMLWRFKTKGAVTAAPIVVGSRVYVGSADGRFYGCDIATGKLVFEYETGGHIIRAASYDESGVAVATGKRVIYLPIK